MPPTADDSRAGDPGGSATVTEADERQPDPQVMHELGHDRWHWRRKIRANPRKRAVYRVLVGIAGLFFVVAGLVTGPLPGPGGIPLVLLGLAIWASEFHWAHRLMQWFKKLLVRFRSWSRRKQVAFWAVFFVCCATLGYTYLLVLGVPGWMPTVVATHLARLPGV